MREFLYLRDGLRGLQPSTRLAYSLFLALSLASYGIMLALGITRAGLSPASIADYYAGHGDHYAKTTGELLEVTHFHLFAMPLILFVMGHLFLMTRWPRPLKLAIVWAAFAGAALDLAAPWLVVYVARDLAFVKVLARVLLAPALIAFVLVPFHEMWFARARPRGGAQADVDERATLDA